MKAFSATIGTTYTLIADFTNEIYQKDNLEIQSNGSQKLEFVWYFGETNPSSTDIPEIIVNQGLVSSTFKKPYITRKGQLWGRCQSSTVDVFVNIY
jgi:hypothetical protein